MYIVDTFDEREGNFPRQILLPSGACMLDSFRILEATLRYGSYTCSQYVFHVLQLLLFRFTQRKTCIALANLRWSIINKKKSSELKIEPPCLVMIFRCASLLIPHVNT